MPCDFFQNIHLLRLVWDEKEFLLLNPLSLGRGDLPIFYLQPCPWFLMQYRGGLIDAVADLFRGGITHINHADVEGDDLTCQRVVAI